MDLTVEICSTIIEEKEDMTSDDVRNVCCGASRQAVKILGSCTAHRAHKFSLIYICSV